MVVSRTSSARKAPQRHPCALCVGRLCGNSKHRVDAMDEIPFRRFHRRHLKSAVAWVDSETILGLVGPSSFYSLRDVDVSFRINCQLLARRIHVACPHDRLRRDGSVLCLVIGGFCSFTDHFATSKSSFFFLKNPAPPDIYTFSLHDPLRT